MARKVKIITSLDCKALLATTADYETPINNAFKTIVERGGIILKTEYLISNHGYLEGAIIEYEL